MMAPRWRKVLVDLWANKMRTVLVSLSIAVGVFAVGINSSVLVTMSHDMDASYLATSPAGAMMAATDFDSDFVEALSHVPGVGVVEGRTQLGGLRIRTPQNGWKDLSVLAASDLERMTLDRKTLLSGNWPARREIAIESVGLQRSGLKVGDSVQIELPGGKLRELRVVGAVEDRNTDPGGLSLNAYVTLDTLETLGQARRFNYLLYTAADQANDKEHVRLVGRQIEDQFSRSGGTVIVTMVRDPGRHPAYNSAMGIMGLLAALGVLSLFLSAFLVVNTISALLGQQVRHIGMMKAIGARTSQIVGMYLVMLLCFGLLALLLAAPLAILAGRALSSLIANALNFGLSPFRLDPLVLGPMVGLSLIVPLAAGLVPVLGGARKTVRAALSGYGLNDTFGRSLIDRLVERVHGLSRPLLISLRNTIRRKARLALTLATLVLAGAIFIGVFSVRASLFGTVTQMYRYFLSDVNVDFDRSYRVDSIENTVREIPGVTNVEGWIFAAGEVLQQGNVATDRIIVLAPPADSKMVERSVLAGRWLVTEDQNALVVSSAVMRSNPELKLGSQLRLKLNGKTKETFVIVGTFPFAEGDGNKIAFAPYDYLADLLGQRGQASTYRITTAPNDATTQDRIAQGLSEQFKSMGYKPTVSAGHVQQDGLGMVLNTIVAFMLFMSLLIALVGGLGLLGTMGMNVMERTREIGVLRSIGASSGAVIQLVLVEGVLIGLLSWMGGVVLALPIGQLLSGVLGQSLFGTSLGFQFAWDGVTIWLVIVLVLSTLASILPAWNAARLTVREVLAYE